MRPGSQFMERARCFFTSNQIFTHVFNTQPQLGVPQRRWPVNFFLLEAAGCWIQTTNPSVSESSNNICQVTSQQFSLTFVLEIDFFWRQVVKKLSGGSSRRNALCEHALNIFMRISCAVIRGSTSGVPTI